jgi:hypothetical protein
VDPRSRLRELAQARDLLPVPTSTACWVLEEALLLSELGRPTDHLPVERARYELGTSPRISALVRGQRWHLPAFVEGLRGDLRPEGNVEVEWDRVPGHLVDVADRALAVRTTGTEWFASIAATSPAPATLWRRTVRRATGELLQQRPMRLRVGRDLAEGDLLSGDIRFDLTGTPSRKPRTPEELRRQLQRQDSMRRAFLRRLEEGLPFLAEILVRPNAVTRRVDAAAGAT